MKYSVDQLYQLAMQMAQEIVQSRTLQAAVLVAIATAIFVIAASRWIGTRKTTGCCISLVVAFVLAVGSFSFTARNLSADKDRIGHDLANLAISQGVDVARKAQATELQYIHAVVSEYGVDRIDCERTVNHHDACQQNTDWYSHEEINVYYTDEEDCSTDSDGEEHCTTHRVKHWDDEYTPYFSYILRYWIVADTKLKYLHEGVYQMVAGDPNSKPKVYAHGGWRAPEDPGANTYQNRGLSTFWQYDAHVPEFWTRVRSAAHEGNSVVTASFVGHYFNWGLAAESSQFQTYDGHYKNLKKLVQLPGPSGVGFNYTDAFGQPATMQTLLTSRDGDLALEFAPVTAIGVMLSPELLDRLNHDALVFQGHAGPNKEASVRWYIVPDSIVQKMGGLINVTTAIKAWQHDTNVWGHFELAKNLVIHVASVSDDGTMITGRDMETGMPFGNVLVEQRIRLSIEPGDSLPLSSQMLFGSFSGTYTETTKTQLGYSFSDMSAAGQVIGLMYETTSGWNPPDPNGDQCSTAPAEHLGFIRYQMCTQQYRESTIQINKDGALLILDGVTASAANEISVWYGWVMLLVAGLFAGVTAFVEFGEANSSGVRRYSR